MNNTNKVVIKLRRNRMEVVKRCGNCGKYPFCEDTERANGCCEKWIKRELIEIKREEER